MTNIDSFERVTTYVVAALLFHVSAVDAFQARRPLASPPCSSSLTIAPIQKNSWSAKSMMDSLPRRRHQLTRNGRELFVATEFGDSAVRDQHLSELLTPTTSTTKLANNSKRGRKRRAILKMRQEHFSRPIDSRLGRALLFPLRLLIWKPLWIVLDTFIDRLADDGTIVQDSGQNSTIAFSTGLKVVAATTTAPELDTAKLETAPTADDKETKGVIPEIASKTASRIDLATPQSAAEMKESVEGAEDTTRDGTDTPVGDRWAVAAPGVDLSGKWELIVTDDFKKDYDKYLAGLGQPKIVRSVALSGPVIGQTMEQLVQTDRGRSLLIDGKNVRGTWKRTLTASGTTELSDHFEPLITSISTVDKEKVESEAWWEEQGTVHVSWMRGVTMYGGGSFYSRRYLEEKKDNDETVYVCDSFFEFNDPKKGRNKLVWRFRRQ